MYRRLTFCFALLNESSFLMAEATQADFDLFCVIDDKLTMTEISQPSPSKLRNYRDMAEFMS